MKIFLFVGNVHNTKNVISFVYNSGRRMKKFSPDVDMYCRGLFSIVGADDQTGLVVVLSKLAHTNLFNRYGPFF